MWPVGPEPPGVYWRRRVVALVVLLLVLVLVWWLIWGRGGDSGASPEPTPAPTTTSSTTSSPEPTASPTVAPTETVSPSPTSTEITDCFDEDILIEASAEQAIYPVGSTPALTLTITNIGTRACRRNVGPGANELKITSGDWTVWSSDDCNPSDEKDMVTLDRGEAFETQLVWDGYISEAGCPPDEPMADPGEYTIIGRNGNLESAPSALRLE